MSAASTNPSAAAARAAQPTFRDEPRATGADTQPGDAPSAEPWLLDCRTRGTTRAAGLLFLLHVVVELGVFAELARAELLERRLVRWSIHRLGMTLAEVAEDDCAALAFAGLQPGARPPSHGGPPPSPEETELFARLGARVLERARDRVDPTASAASIRARIVARAAEIVSDQGWFDVYLDPRSVAVEIRKAGLDLDLGFVAALGAVVRFHYE
jgi:hypothetical protein